MTRFFTFLILLFVITGFISCNSSVQEDKSQSVLMNDSGQVPHPEWTKNATIYELNIRQFSNEGTFKAVEEQLTRLKAMGIDILWLMPIHPIGIKNRKGTMGSFYSVMDYKAVNPDYGTLDDFKELVKKAHELGMYVIIDWVANHSAWDNPWVTEHPDWYTKDSTGKMISPFDWTDVADLNYDNKDLWAAMIDALEYWVKEADIDGYRCDVAELVPVEFWNSARESLDKIKPVFMLAEAEKTELHKKAFDMTYAWELHFLLNSVYKGEKSLDDLNKYFQKEKQNFSPAAYRMQFTSNHDENSWKGSEYERMGEGVKAFAVFTALIPGMPLVYNGQESCLKKKLLFFEKDTIGWGNYSLAGFYSKLLKLKHENQALWNGQYGGSFTRLQTNADSAVYAFERIYNDKIVLVAVNFSAAPVKVNFNTDAEGVFNDLFADKTENVNGKIELQLNPWDYKVLYK